MNADKTWTNADKMGDHVGWDGGGARFRTVDKDIRVGLSNILASQDCW